MSLCHRSKAHMCVCSGFMAQRTRFRRSLYGHRSSGSHTAVPTVGFRDTRFTQSLYRVRASPCECDDVVLITAEGRVTVLFKAPQPQLTAGGWVSKCPQLRAGFASYSQSGLLNDYRPPLVYLGTYYNFRATRRAYFSIFIPTPHP